MLKNPVFAAIGLICAVATVVLYGLAIAGYETGVIGVFTILLGGLFLLLGLNSQSERDLF